MARAFHKLTARTAETLKAPGRHGDGAGLYLEIEESGSKRWTLRYRAGGKRRDMGLGSYPIVSLARARLLAEQARRQIVEGIDPIAARKEARSPRESLTFRAMAAEVIDDAQAKSSNAKVRYQWALLLGPAYCAPLLDRPVHEITTSDVQTILAPVWHTKPETARKLYRRIRRVFDHARVRLRDRSGIEFRDNPARWDDLKALGFEAPRKLSRGRHPSLPYRRLPEFVASLSSRKSVAALALEFLILTGVRTDAVLGAQWSEFDLRQALWSIPLDRLKDRKHRIQPFRVPLSERAVEIIQHMRECKSGDYVFPGMRWGKPLSAMAMISVIRKMNARTSKPEWLDEFDGPPIVPHGFRATFKTWAEETTAFPHVVTEEVLGHQVGSEVERAYRRTDHLQKRREVMEAWGEFSRSSTLSATE